MENRPNKIEFSCACGKRFRIPLEHGGRSYTCPACGKAGLAPAVASADTVRSDPTHARPHRVTARASDSRVPGFALKPPATVGQLTLYLVGAWLVIGIVCGLLALFSIYLAVAGLILSTASTAVVGHQIWSLIRARQRVLVKKNVPLLWGFVRLIAWDPVEGVLILRNKSVEFCDDNLEDGRGGVRFLYSILGEELALRAPLEVQTLGFCDEKVLTREYLSVTVRGTMKWRIVDIRKFYLLVSRELRSTTNHNDRETVSPSTRPVITGDESAESAIRRLLRAAIGWMQVLVEEETRAVVSRARSGLLIADRLSQELFTQVYEHPEAESHASTVAQGEMVQRGGAVDGLAAAILDTIARRLEAYGIAVEDVSLQEIKLPDEIMRECIEACRAYYMPTIAKRTASFTLEQLQAQADVIGREAVATREVVAAAPAFTLPDFLSSYLQKRLSPTTHGGGHPEVGLTAAMAAATQAALSAKHETAPMHAHGIPGRPQRHDPPE